MGKKVTVIFNPVAGGHARKPRLKLLTTLLDEQLGGNYHIKQTTGPGDAINIAREAVVRECELLIVAGGDGTINETVNGMLSAEQSHPSLCELGILNLGSGGDLARTLKLPKRMDHQLEIILSRPGRPIDVGILECMNSNMVPLRRFFINECQVGIGGAVVYQMGNFKKQFAGPLEFGIAALKQLFNYASPEMQLQLDHQHIEFHKMLGVVVANGIYSAGGMKMAPGALIDDGWLNILHMSEMNILNRLLTFAKVYAGAHVKSKFAHYQPAQKIKIASRQPVWIEADGELIGKTPCTIKIIPHGLFLKVEK